MTATTITLSGKTFDLIGEYSDTRPTCDGSGHKPRCFHPWMGETACICGTHWWPGWLPTWHARFLYDHGGKGARLLGFDVYVLPGYPPAQGGARCES